jgi:tetratricopeptide (TPR) repeat protein
MLYFAQFSTVSVGDDMTRRLCVLLLLFVLVPTFVLFGQVRTIQATGEYRMGDNDTRNDARKLALMDAKRLALEKAGSLLESTTEVKNMQLSRDDIGTYTAGILEIVDQKEQTSTDGNTTVVRIEVTVQIDTAKVLNQIAALRDNSASKSDLQELKAEMDKLRETVAKQNQELATIKSKAEADKIIRQRQQAISGVEVDTLLTQAWVALTGTEGGLLSTGKSSVEGRAQARRLVEQAMQIDPANPKVHLRMGNVMEEEGNRSGAIAELREALRLNPNYAGAHNSLGISLRASGDNPGAIAEYREAIRINPNDAIPHYNLALILESQKDLSGAALEFREALRLRPNYRAAHNALGNVLRAQKDLNGALTQYREAIRLEPAYPASHENLGIALRDLKDLDGAAAAFREAIRLKADYSAPHYNLGLTLRDQGKKQEAAEEFREFLRLVGEDPSQKAFADRARAYLQGN